MTELTPELEALYALHRNVPRSELSMGAQLEYDRLRAAWERGEARPAAGALEGGPARLGARADPAAEAVQIRCLECGAESAEITQFCLRCGAPRIGPQPAAVDPAPDGPGDSSAAVAARSAGSPLAQAGRYQRNFLICLIFFLIVCSASMAWINKVPGGTSLSHALGWAIGFSVIGALLSLVVLVLGVNLRSNQQIAWMFVPVLSLSFLAFVPFLWLAIIHRQARDWFVFACYLAAVAAEILLVRAGLQGSTVWSISYVMIPLVAGTAAVRALAAFSPAAGLTFLALSSRGRG